MLEGSRRDALCCILLLGKGGSERGGIEDELRGIELHVDRGFKVCWAIGRSSALASTASSAVVWKAPGMVMAAAHRWTWLRHFEVPRDPLLVRLELPV